MESITLPPLTLEPACYVVATPIGNLSDISLRALSLLSKIEYIFCEDTRITNKLLQYYNCGKKKLIAYHKYSNEDICQKAIDLVKNGNAFALMSDAGTPMIADPGYQLINKLHLAKIKTIAIPGCSSLVSALCISGASTDHFQFFGFLPNSEESCNNFLVNIKNNEGTLVFFESPQRIITSLSNIAKHFGERKIIIARELTKIYEEVITGKAVEVIEFLQNSPKKICGEIVLIIDKDYSKKILEAELSPETINLIKILQDSNISKKDIANIVAKYFKTNKKIIYQEIIKE